MFKSHLSFAIALTIVIFLFLATLTLTSCDPPPPSPETAALKQYKQVIKQFEQAHAKRAQVIHDTFALRLQHLPSRISDLTKEQNEKRKALIHERNELIRLSRQQLEKHKHNTWLKYKNEVLKIVN